MPSQVRLGSQISGTAEIPGIDRLREILNAEEKKIRKQVEEALVPVKSGYAARLEEFKVALTKEGKLQEAKAIRDEILDLKAGSIGEESTTPKETTPPEMAEADSDKIPLQASGKMGGDVKLVPGRYRLRRPLVGGDNDLPKGDPLRLVNLKIPAGCTIEGEPVYIEEGVVSAEGSLFRKTNLQADLGGSWEVKGSLFDEVLFEKKGGWFAGFSARYAFENCVFRKSTFGKPGRPNMGLKIVDSTFLDCEFDPVSFGRDDAAEEIVEEWLTVRGCHFVDCSLPQSFLLVTEDCVFKNCRFGDAEEIPVKSRIGVTLFTDPPTAEISSGKEEIQFRIKDADRRVKPVGASLGYEVKGGRLEFREGG